MKAKAKTPVIELNNVCKYYYLGEDEVKAVDKINLKIYSQEYVSILGSSGSGKSTLMYLIGLLETPSSGQILVNGQDVSQLSDSALSHIRNQTIGFIFQSFNLINKMTVLENILLPVKYHINHINFNPYDRAQSLLKKFSLDNRQQFFPNKISGGQQQRVAIARALIMNPKIVLADEPTGNLDSKTGNEILNLIESLNRDFKTTLIMITHEHDVAQRAKTLIYIKDGQVVAKYL
jgi:putative ABC transport system ATP-binding protein